MHGTVIRGHTLGISFGTPLSVETSLDVFNDQAYEAIDFAILAARIYGIKLLIPLVDNVSSYVAFRHFIANLACSITGAKCFIPHATALSLTYLQVPRRQVSVYPVARDQLYRLRSINPAS